jgi:DNA-binding transcriptional MerR regulator
MELKLNPNKLYYSISEVAEMFDVNASLIRFWEKEFDIFKQLKKNAKGNRMFTVRELQQLQLVYHLVKEQKLTLEGARKKLKENKDGSEHTLEIITKLKTIRQELIDIKEAL